MDAARNKAYLRAQLKEAAQKREKRIDSPLVRYNDLGQPVCKVCNVSVKSEALWPAHLVSSTHKERVDLYKAQVKGAAAQITSTTHPENVESSKPKVRASSSLPDDFFDASETKRVALDGMAKHDRLSGAASEIKLNGNTKEDSKTFDKPAPAVKERTLFSEKSASSAVQSFTASNQASQLVQNRPVTAKTAQGALPEGFFDNIDADHRARGLEPPKYDMQDEWKEFQKSIRDDIQEVDLRMEEEEFDAAEDREKLETLEQRVLLERVEKLRQKQYEKAEETEITEVIAKVVSKKPFSNVNLTLEEDSDSDDDIDDGNLLVDWRAKQF